MGGFGVRHYDGNRHYFSVLSSEDLSVSRKFELAFDKDQYVRGGSCGELLYFHGDKDKKIIIISLTTNQVIVVPPPEFNPPPYKPHKKMGQLVVSGLGYDAKSGDFKLIRHYEDYFENKRLKQFMDLYQFNSLGLWREPRTWRPGYTTDYMNATGVYLGQTGSCYWVGSDATTIEEDMELFAMHEQRFQELSRSDVTASPDSLLMHVVSFDFATERFGRLPLPAPPIALRLMYKLVRYCGLLGAVVYEYNCTCSEMAVQLFVWKGSGSWESVYGVVYLDARRPVGLKDDRLFLEAEASGKFNQLMVYDFKTKESKKLDIYGYPGQLSVFCYGAESTDPPLPGEEEEEEEEDWEGEGEKAMLMSVKVKLHNSIEEVELLPLKIFCLA